MLFQVLLSQIVLLQRQSHKELQESHSPAAFIQRWAELNTSRPGLGDSLFCLMALASRSLRCTPHQEVELLPSAVPSDEYNITK